MYKTGRRVVITGVGAVTPLGIGVENMWNNYVAGASGIVNGRYPPSHARVAALVQGFDQDEFRASFQLGKAHLKKMSPGTMYSLIAAREALSQAGITSADQIDSNKFGSIVGTAIGGARGITQLARLVDQGLLPDIQMVLRILAERYAVVPGQRYNARAFTGAITDACASGNVAQAISVEQIFLGEADIMLTLGTEDAIINELMALFEPTKTTTINHIRRTASRPLDVDRTGFVCGEGVGCMIIESLESAIRRGATPLAEIVGHKNTADADRDTDPNGEGSKRAMLGALGRIDEGVIREQEALYFNLHGTGTRVGDPIETTKVSEVADEYSPNMTAYANAVKERFGHLFGAAGLIEGIITIKTLQTGMIIPHRNIRRLIKEADRLTVPLRDIIYTPNLLYGVNNSFGFGGINSSIVYKKWVEDNLAVL